jgi:hypothetical protein
VCGPDTVTLGLAEVVTPGEVVGIDSGPSYVERARAVAAERGLSTMVARQGPKGSRAAHAPAKAMAGIETLEHRAADPSGVGGTAQRLDRRRSGWGARITLT